MADDTQPTLVVGFINQETENWGIPKSQKRFQYYNMGLILDDLGLPSF